MPVLKDADRTVRLLVSSSAHGQNMMSRIYQREVFAILDHGEVDHGEVDQEQVRVVDLELWPVSHRFAAGHRIRVQVSSGAHPRFNRNPGTGDPLATATELRAADQEIWHDSDHPSAIMLPVII